MDHAAGCGTSSQRAGAHCVDGWPGEPVGDDEYLRRGYPIASGVIEGACRQLVKDRMERCGMRWTLEGARSMLNVRAAFQCDHWRTFVDWDMKNEITRTHPNKNLLQGYTPERLAC